MNSINAKDNYNKRILLIENNHLNLRIMSRLLQKMDIDVVEVNNSQEAIKLAAQEDFSLIFMCVFIPDNVGYEITKNISKLCEIHRDTPIILVSSNKNQLVTDKMLECGISDVISKPLKEDEVKKIFHKYRAGKASTVNQESMNFIIFDKKVFESFYNDNNLQKEIISIFISERENDLDRIAKAFGSDNIENIYDAFHYMKGSFTYLKANILLELTQQILDLLKAEKLEDVLLLKDTFYKNYNMLFKELSFYFNNI